MGYVYMTKTFPMLQFPRGMPDHWVPQIRVHHPNLLG